MFESTGRRGSGEDKLVPILWTTSTLMLGVDIRVRESQGRIYPLTSILGIYSYITKVRR